MKARPAPLLASSIAVLVLCAAALPETDSSKGLVVGIKGDWALNKTTGNPGNRVQFLSQFESGDGATCAYGTGGYVTIAFGDKAVPYLCEIEEQEKGPCHKKDAPNPPSRDSKPYVCAREIAPPKSQNFGQRAWAALLFQVHKSPELSAVPVSRGLESDLDDAVLQKRGDIVEFGPAFAEMDPGSYAARLESLEAPGKALATIHVEWKEGAAAGAGVPGLAAGLYGLVRVQADGKPAGEEAWVLVTTPEKFAKQSGDFAAFSAATKQWPDQVDARAPRAVSRAYLRALAGGAE